MRSLWFFLLGMSLMIVVNLTFDFYTIKRLQEQSVAPIVISPDPRPPVPWPLTPIPISIPISTTEPYTAFKLYEGYIVVMAPFKETDVAEDIAVLESLVDPTLPVTCFLMINVGVKYESEIGTWYAPYDHPCLIPKKDLKKKGS